MLEVHARIKPHDRGFFPSRSEHSADVFKLDHFQRYRIETVRAHGLACATASVNELPNSGAESLRLARKQCQCFPVHLQLFGQFRRTLKRRSVTSMLVQI